MLHQKRGGGPQALKDFFAALFFDTVPKALGRLNLEGEAASLFVEIPGLGVKEFRDLAGTHEVQCWVFCGFGNFVVQRVGVGFCCVGPLFDWPGERRSLTYLRSLTYHKAYAVIFSPCVCISLMKARFSTSLV